MGQRNRNNDLHGFKQTLGTLLLFYHWTVSLLASDSVCMSLSMPSNHCSTRSVLISLSVKREKGRKKKRYPTATSNRIHSWDIVGVFSTVATLFVPALIWLKLAPFDSEPGSLVFSGKRTVSHRQTKSPVGFSSEMHGGGKGEERKGEGAWSTETNKQLIWQWGRLLLPRMKRSGNVLRLARKGRPIRS